MSETNHIWVTRVLVVAIVVVLGGCEQTQDPSRAGFFGGINNLATGAYDQRLQQKQQELSRSQQLRDEMAVRAMTQQQAARQTEAELSAWRNRVAAMDRELAQMQQRLTIIKRQRGAADLEVQEAERRFRQLTTYHQQAKGDQAPTPDEKRRYEDELQAARRAIALVSRVE